MNTKNNPNPSNPARPSARNPQRHKRAQGFTIIELMITLTVAAILLAIAIPSFTYLTVSSKLTTTANSLVNALGTARSEAIKRNTNVVVGMDGSVAITSVTPAVTINAAIPVQTPVIVLNIPAALTATPMGMLTSGGTAGFTGLAADVSSTKISSNNHRCVYITTGTTITSCTDSVACQAGSPNASCK
ncbi:MAG: GspH/FimT family pseudopilin [Halothiobacillaceae bacterium]|nr:GspH/FimT family pseudopilin [Halothiobacillaceae bacterium]